ncbi:hypothetical protein CTAYLR_006835 [Chrysophaeum taylorii]|uniref:CSD domain-containing protein n=1 Tax=Chrysophaeum taylorii TaxID=2483200 RepID=A0AAD7UDK7_9STRA|nr:hypothetical protein CTAYLR_006835 [Chrysophaeum taylorii]
MRRSAGLPRRFRPRQRAPSTAVAERPAEPAELHDLVVLLEGSKRDDDRCHVGDVRRGRVQVYFEERRFGFIKPLDGGRDVFFHKSMMREPLRFDDVVEFSVDQEIETKAHLVVKVEPELSSDADIRFLQQYPDEYIWLARESEEGHRRRRERQLRREYWRSRK